MHEVEVKIQIENAGQTIQTLQDRLCVFEAPVIQRDIVYIPNEVPTVPCPAGTNVLRIRKQGSKNYFTLKQSLSQNHLAKLEHELEISSAEELDKIIKLLGFKKIAETTKTRRKCKIGSYEICIDEVENLGSFLEIEHMTESDPLIVQEDMVKFLTSLGVETSKRVLVGYDVLWVQKYGPSRI